MANPRPTLEGVITSCLPVLESIIQNLSPWEIRNLQLAGVRIPVGREFQRRHHVPNCCNEISLIRLGPPCDNTTESFDVRSCKGRPMEVKKNGKILLEERVGNTPMEPCLRDEWWRLILANPNPDPHPEPNRDRYPIHTKICQPCRDVFVAELLEAALLTIARYNTPLCKAHSLDHAIAQFPPNACRCLAFINEPWRCRRCHFNALDYLAYRAHNKPPFRRSLPVWRRAWVFFKRFWSSKQPAPRAKTHPPYASDRNITRRYQYPKDVANLNHLFRDQISTFSMSQSAGIVLDEPGKLADFAATVSAGEIRELQEVLETMNIDERLSKALMVFKKELMNAQLHNNISKDVELKIPKRQREYWLMEQMKGIRCELGIESDGKEKNG
ncbi:ATP-dependent Lon protease pim1 [Pseudocyphellaria aurata]|nr:ATP-dependent Lon protease pim1 [Pseudocyphellaria aurata]